MISPLFFPGGDIGALSVHGTVNDVAMMGAQPLYLSASFILEEACRWRTSSASSTRWPRPRAEAGVAIVTGDTKVVERGHGDGVSSSAPPARAGCRRAGAWAATLAPGDVVLVSARSGTTAWRCCRSASRWSSRPRSSPTAPRSTA